MNELEEYFRKLRFDENFHLGLGDVRLTIAMQEEVVAIVALENEWVAQHQNAQHSVHLSAFSVGAAAVNSLQASLLAEASPATTSGR